MNAISLLAAREAARTSVHLFCTGRCPFCPCLLRNTLCVQPLEIKRRSRIWILVLHPRHYPFECTRAEVRIQSIADAGARTLTSLDRRWTPSDAWLENGIRCMMASSASKSCGILDTSPEDVTQARRCMEPLKTSSWRWHPTRSAAQQSEPSREAPGPLRLHRDSAREIPPWPRTRRSPQELRAAAN